MDDSVDSTSTSDPDISKEPDTSSVDFRFLKSGKSGQEGVLLSHGDTFKFHKGGSSRDNERWWYSCAMRKTLKCTARATVVRHEVELEDGEIEVRNYLVDITAPEGHNHVPDKAQIIANDLLVKMKERVESDPLSPVSKIRDQVMMEELDQYNPELKKDIISSLPKNPRSTLNAHRNKILGYQAKSRDEYDPSVILSRNQFGKNIIVIDSDKDLPDNWHKIDLASLFPERRKDPPDVATSDDGTSEEEQADRSFFDYDNLESEHLNLNSSLQSQSDDSLDDSLEVSKPDRILIFTSLELLSLLALSKHGSVDGTFKSISKHWKQLFIFLCEYKKAYLPVCFSWLPDKTSLSYHVMLLLLLTTFRKR